jgi:hypothetical protein
MSIFGPRLNLGACDVLARPFDHADVIRSVSLARLHWQDRCTSGPAGVRSQLGRLVVEQVDRNAINALIGTVQRRRKSVVKLFLGGSARAGRPLDFTGREPSGGRSL